MLDRARRPLLLLGSQATLAAGEVAELRAAVESLAVPVYLTGMGRGLLGRDHTLQLRHQRKEALRQADLVILAGVPMDFRLDYGRNIGTRARVIALNRSTEDLTKNRRPSLAALGDAAGFLRALATRRPMGHWQRPDWLSELRERDQQREREIDRQAAAGEGGVNPIALCRRLEVTLGEDCILVGDGGDFVATASYVVRPRGPLTWLDPGVFGTLGSGAGFALGAKLARPKSDVWILYGDGSVGYTLPEFDTFVRHHVPIIGVVGNDGGWQQIAREQVETLGDPVGTELPQADYHKVAQGFGAEGLLVSNDEQCGPALRRARELSRTGAPVLVNALCRRTAFRKGSVSI
jgi:acetolactate synthase-1/2/3 large subunit